MPSIHVPLVDDRCRLQLLLLCIVKLGDAVHLPSLLDEPSTLHASLTASAAFTARHGEFAVREDSSGCPKSGGYHPYCCNCYSAPWFEEMRRVNPQGGGRVFMDIGCNTGSDAVGFLERWGTHPGVAIAWDALLLMHGAGSGACGQNLNNLAIHPKDKFLIPRAKKVPSLENPQVLCVEPMPSTVKLLHKVAKATQLTNDTFRVVQAAVGEREGSVLFPDGEMGRESLGIGVAKGHATVPVRQTTVDLLLKEHQLSKVDILTIDTEGHDPAVLRGAQGALSEGRVRFLVFEVHQDLKNTTWASTSLLGEIQRLDSWQFDCYWAGNNGKVNRITGCWTAELEAKHRPIGWSNVVCARRGDPWHSILERHDLGV